MLVGRSRPCGTLKLVRVPVVVVGAGLAGLVTATRLRRAGVDVVLLEASGRVGGRTLSERVDDQVLDLGADLVGESYRDFRSLVAQSGLHLVPVPRPRPWQVSMPASLRPQPSIATLVAAWRVTRWLRGELRKVSTGQPWAAAGAWDLDAVSVESWLRAAGVDDGSRRLVAAVLGTLAGVPSDRLAMLHAVWWLAPPGGLVPTLRGETRWRVAEGAQAVSQRLACDLGDRVRLGAAVTRLEQTGS